MANERQKPTTEQVKWFKNLGEEITRLEKEIKSKSDSEGLFDQTLSQINHHKYEDPACARVDLIKIKDERDKQKLITDKTISLVISLTRVRNLSGICPTCSGTGGFYLIKPSRPLNEPTPTCTNCWGSGWKDGNENPFDKIVEDVIRTHSDGL